MNYKLLAREFWRIAALLCMLTSCKADTPIVDTVVTSANQDRSNTKSVSRDAQTMSIQLPSGIIPTQLATDNEYIYWIDLRNPLSIDRVRIDGQGQIEQTVTSKTITKNGNTGLAGLQISLDGVWMAYHDYVRNDDSVIHVRLQVRNIATADTQTLFDHAFDAAELKKPVAVYIPQVTFDNNKMSLNYSTQPDASGCAYSVIEIFDLNLKSKSELVRSGCNAALEWRQPHLYSDRIVVSQLDWAVNPVSATMFLFDLKHAISKTIVSDGKGSEPILIDNAVVWRNAYALEFSNQLAVLYLAENVTRVLTLEENFAHVYGAGGFVTTSTGKRVDLIDVRNKDDIRVTTLATFDTNGLQSFGDKTITRQYFAFVEFPIKRIGEPPRAIIRIHSLK
jgi:hypothetical protein